MYEIIMDTVIDGLKLLPFLFVAFLIIEFTEHKLSEKVKRLLKSLENMVQFLVDY